MFLSLCQLEVVKASFISWQQLFDAVRTVFMTKLICLPQEERSKLNNLCVTAKALDATTQKKLYSDIFPSSGVLPNSTNPRNPHNVLVCAREVRRIMTLNQTNRRTNNNSNDNAFELVQSENVNHRKLYVH